MPHWDPESLNLLTLERVRAAASNLPRTILELASTMIHYHSGDATRPFVRTGTRVIAHVCNDAGKWGAGFSGAISAKWKEPEEFFRKQFRFAKNRFKLGAVQWAFVDLGLAVVNMIAQEGVRSSTNPKPIRYEALEKCLDKVAEGCHGLIGDSTTVKKRRVTIHMPRIACGLAGGTWGIVGPLVEDAFWDLEVYVYDWAK